MEQWFNYFTMTAEAAATLTGLVFVAVSLNLQKILSVKHLPGRAFGSLILLVNVLIVSSFVLIPEQSGLVLGLEIIILGTIFWIFNTYTAIKMFLQPGNEFKSYHIINLILTQLALLPYIIAGICLLLNFNNGFYWLIAGVTFSFIKALMDSWILLVEINR